MMTWLMTQYLLYHLLCVYAHTLLSKNKIFLKSQNHKNLKNAFLMTRLKLEVSFLYLSRTIYILHDIFIR